MGILIDGPFSVYVEANACSLFALLNRIIECPHGGLTLQNTFHIHRKHKELAQCYLIVGTSSTTLANIKASLDVSCLLCSQYVGICGLVKTTI